MRRTVVGRACALSLVLAVAVAGVAQAATQNIQAGFSPKPDADVIFGQPIALDDKKFSKKGTLSTRVFFTDIAGTPPAAATVAIDFGAEGRISTRGIPVCTAEQLTLKTPEQAEEACGDARLGRGSASAFLNASSSLTGPVDAFNGPKVGGDPTILFLSNVGTPIVLTGLITDSPAGPQYGKRLSVPVAQPEGPVPPGIVITDFETTVSRLVKNKGKGKRKKKRTKTSYVSARCTDGVAEFQGTFTYVNAPTEVVHTTQPCTTR